MTTTYSIEKKDSIPIIRVNDLLTETDHQKILAAAQHHLIDSANRLIVDLSGIQMMNSVGLNFLLVLYQRSEKNGGKLALAHASSKVQELLRVTKLNNHFYMSDSIDDALDYVG